MDGRETVGNSMGRALWGRSDSGVTTGWTEGNPWEIAWGELRGGKERCGNDDRVDGRETWEIAWGELRGKGARWKRRHGGRRGSRATRWWTSEIAWVVLSNCAYSRRCLHLEKNGETMQKEWKWKMQI